MSAGKRAPLVLLVLDGWGLREEREGNAIKLASKTVDGNLCSNIAMAMAELDERTRRRPLLAAEP